MSQSPPNFRPARLADLDGLVALNSAALAETGADIAGVDWPKDLEHLVRNGGGSFLVGETAGGIVAMGGVAIDAGVAEFCRIRIHPAQQRQGLGRAILTALESYAAERGVATFRAETSTVQTRAQRLYEAAGYEIVSRSKAHGHDTLIYEKPCRPS